eukprot:3290587-Amphidinium_carterae.2
MRLSADMQRDPTPRIDSKVRAQPSKDSTRIAQVPKVGAKAYCSNGHVLHDEALTSWIEQQFQEEAKEYQWSCAAGLRP